MIGSQLPFAFWKGDVEDLKQYREGGYNSVHLQQRNQYASLKIVVRGFRHTDMNGGVILSLEVLIIIVVIFLSVYKFNIWAAACNKTRSR